jgi:hypothetical protein
VCVGSGCRHRNGFFGRLVWQGFEGGRRVGIWWVFLLGEGEEDGFRWWLGVVLMSELGVGVWSMVC